MIGAARQRLNKLNALRGWAAMATTRGPLRRLEARRFARLGGTPIGIDCCTKTSGRALWVLAPDQPTAVDHGALETGTTRSARLTAPGCACQPDPLAGATGQGGAVWTRLPAALARCPGPPPLRMSILAVDATSAGHSARPERVPLARLGQDLGQLARWGFPADGVLWHQGEAYARLNTTASPYRLGSQPTPGAHS